MTDLAGIPIIICDMLPTREPTPGEWAVRFVRHQLADVLEWLGEEVGPEPDEPITVAFLVGDALYRAEQRAAFMVMRPEAVTKIVGLS